MEIKNNEVSYGLTGDSRRAIVHSYHSKPSPRDMKKGGKKDIQGLPRKAQVQLVNHDGDSKFTIGFEVEKNSLSRYTLKEYELFCGFERDGSCGYEAVTNILPLLPPSRWRMKVFDMMVKASRVIEDTHSPSDARCGGHITVAVDGMDGEQLLAKMRPYAGVIFALYHNRLENTYCKFNPTLLSESDSNDWVNLASSYSDRYHSKYRVALPKGSILEWRVPSRFTSVKQMMRRYELMYEIVNASVSGDGSERSFKALIRKVKPIMLSLYDKDEAKLNNRIAMSHDFRKYILSNGREVSAKIESWVTKNNE
jgi:hypothetical protein